jgi:hypothetical protein
VLSNAIRFSEAEGFITPPEAQAARVVRRSREASALRYPEAQASSLGQAAGSRHQASGLAATLCRCPTLVTLGGLGLYVSVEAPDHGPTDASGRGGVKPRTIDPGETSDGHFSYW